MTDIIAGFDRSIFAVPLTSGNHSTANASFRATDGSDLCARSVGHFVVRAGMSIEHLAVDFKVSRMLSWLVDSELSFQGVNFLLERDNVAPQMGMLLTVEATGTKLLHRLRHLRDAATSQPLKEPSPSSKQRECRQRQHQKDQADPRRSTKLRFKHKSGDRIHTRFLYSIDLRSSTYVSIREGETPAEPLGG